MASTSKGNGHKKGDSKKHREHKESVVYEPPEEEIDTDNFDYNEYENIMNYNIRKIIACEIQFNKTIALLRDAKLRQLQRKREEVESGESEDLKERNKSVYSEGQERDDEVNQFCDLQVDSLDRHFEGMMFFADHGGKDTYEFYKQKLEEDLLAEEREIEKQLQDADNVCDMFRKVFIKKKCKSVKDLLRPPKKFKIGADYKKIEKRRKKMKVPLIVYELSKPQMNEDLKFFDDAIMAKEPKDFPAMEEET